MPPKEKQEINVKLKKFNMNLIGDNKIIVMIGSRGRGKSTILIDYLYHNQDIPYACCISTTDCFNSTFTPCIPSRFIFAEYSSELIAKFVKRQRDMKRKQVLAKMGLGEPSYADADCRGILIMDDCLADNKGWQKDLGLRDIFFNGRHADITFILTMQYQIGITPDYRANIDWIFLCKENKKVDRDKLWKYYAGIFPTLSMFEQIFMSCTSNKNCMVIDSLSESERLEDQVFWFKATVRSNFRVCYDEFWVNNDYYIKKRLSMDTIGTSTTQQQNTQQKPQEDYYKYVGGHGKLKFNLDMSDEDEQYQDDYEYMQQSNEIPVSYGSPNNYGYQNDTSKSGFW